MKKTKNPMFSAVLLTVLSITASVFCIWHLGGTIMILCFIFSSIFCVFQLMENAIIEYKCEKEFKHKVFLQEGAYIDLTDEEYERIKYMLNKDAKTFIKSIEGDAFDETKDIKKV